MIIYRYNAYDNDNASTTTTTALHPSYPLPPPTAHERDRKAFRLSGLVFFLATFLLLDVDNDDDNAEVPQASKPRRKEAQMT